MVTLPSSRPTLDQVARAAGVSKGTASKVLNGRPHVSELTRRRVEQVIESLGYSPSTGPRERETISRVYVIFDALDHGYSMQVLDGVVSSAREHHVEVLVDRVVRHPDSTGPLSTTWLRRLARRGDSGVIVVTSQLTTEQRRQATELGLQIVLVDPLDPLDDQVVSVGATNFIGGIQATRHLLDQGHQRIAFAGGSVASSASRERLQGFLSAMRSAGLVPDPGFIQERGFTFHAGVHMAHSLLDARVPPTAIFAGCDAAALGVIEVARQRGIHVPTGLSVVGFDDTPAALMSAPPLTTVRQPIVEMGRVALRTVVQQMRGGRPDSYHVQLSTRLVIRESTAALGPLHE